MLDVKESAEEFRKSSEAQSPHFSTTVKLQKSTNALELSQPSSNNLIEHNSFKKKMSNLVYNPNQGLEMNIQEGLSDTSLIEKKKSFTTKLSYINDKITSMELQDKFTPQHPNRNNYSFENNTIFNTTFKKRERKKFSRDTDFKES